MPVFKYDGTLAAETVAPVNSVFGSTASETLTGTAGADGIWSSGVGGGDTLLGGPGDDTYYLKSPGDRVVEQVDGGTDKIVAWANTDLANFHNVENLEVDGDKTYGAGNSGDNIIYAGATGAHQLFGGGGQDVFVGGGGADTFIIVKGGGNDVIYNFTTQDTVRLTAGFTTFDQVRAHMTQVGADVKLDLGGSDGLIFRNVTAGQFTAANFQLQIDTAKLGAETFHEDFNSPLSIWSAANNPSGTWRTDFGYQGSQGVGSYTEVSNNEQQIYTSPYFRDHNGDFQSPFTSNPDGTLTITAAKSASSEIFGYHYTSGMISTAQSFAQTYGYFEMRAELPTTAGAWPAFWLLPADGSWPPELDVMETLTADRHNDFTTQHSGVGGVHTSLGAASFIPDTSSGFHTYGVLWTATDLTWFVDGVQIFHTATPADMNKPMFMIANMALGGWSGAIDDAHIPAQMKIDYVHAYALADGSSHTVDSATAGLSATLPISVGAAGYQTPSVEGGSLPTTTTSSEPPAASTPPPASPLPVSPPATSPSPTDIHTIVSPGFGSVLNGTAGADTLVSHNGNETMTGGGGADVFSFPTNPWNPTHITDFHAGVNRLDFSKLYLDGYHGTNPVADGYVSFVSDGQGGTKVLLDPDGPATGHPWPDYVVNLDGVDPSSLTAANVFGGPAALPPPPAPLGASPPPSPPQPSSPASGGVGIAGAPTTSGEALHASNGVETLQGGEGNDTLTGASEAANYLRGNGGDDSIQGGASFNDINGNKGDDTINAGFGGNDWLLGGQGNDLITAHSGNNLLYGNLGNDTLIGGGGNDTIRGGQGDDSIVAGSGAQWISGDRGNDTIQAGSGPDTFHTFAQAGLDKVLGFNEALGDHVQLDAGTNYTLSQVGADTVIDMGGGNEMILVGVRLSSLHAGWIFGD
jgi:serralysin